MAEVASTLTSDDSNTVTATVTNHIQSTGVGCANNRGSNARRGRYSRGYLHHYQYPPFYPTEPPATLLKELAAFNSVDPEYTLEDTTQDSVTGQEVFFVRLCLGDSEIYEGSGDSISSAQDSAARHALHNSRLQRPPSKPHPGDTHKVAVGGLSLVEKEQFEGDAGPPPLAKVSSDETLSELKESPHLAEVKQLADKLQEVLNIHYTPVQPSADSRGRGGPPWTAAQHRNNSSAGFFPGPMYPGGSSARNQFMYHPGYGPPPPRGMAPNQGYRTLWSASGMDRQMRATIRVGKREFVGHGRNKEQARESASTKALSSLKATVQSIDAKRAKRLADCEKNGMSDEKNAVSFLFELAAKKGVRLDFEVLPESSPIKRHFAVSCSFGSDAKCRGVGDVKKEAKQNAAKAVLGLLKPLMESEFKAVEAGSMKPGQNRKSKGGAGNVDGEGPSQDPISTLNQWCQSKKRPCPTFACDADSQSKSSRFVISCSLDGKVSEGFGSNKKTAKRSAALNMLKLMNIDFPSAPAGSVLGNHATSAPVGAANVTSSAAGGGHSASLHTYRPGNGRQFDLDANHSDRSNGPRRSFNGAQWNKPAGHLPRGIIFAPDGVPSLVSGGDKQFGHHGNKIPFTSNAPQANNQMLSSRAEASSAGRQPPFMPAAPSNFNLHGGPVPSSQQQFHSQETYMQSFQKPMPNPNSWEVSTLASREPLPSYKIVASEMIEHGYSPSLKPFHGEMEYPPVTHDNPNRFKTLLSSLCRFYGLECQYIDYPKSGATGTEYMTQLLVRCDPQQIVGAVKRTITEAHEEVSETVLHNLAGKTNL